MTGTPWYEHDELLFSFTCVVCAVGRMWFIWCWGLARLHTVRVFISTTVLSFTLRRQPTARCWGSHHGDRISGMPRCSERAEVSVVDGMIPGCLLTAAKQSKHLSIIFILDICDSEWSCTLETWVIMLNSTLLSQ